MQVYRRCESLRIFTIILAMITVLAFMPVLSGTNVFAASAKKVKKVTRVLPTKNSTYNMSKGQSKTFKVKLSPKNLKKTA